jgi:hypothetical protein
MKRNLSSAKGGRLDITPKWDDMLIPLTPAHVALARNSCDRATVFGVKGISIWDDMLIPLTPVTVVALSCHGTSNLSEDLARISGTFCR